MAPLQATTHPGLAGSLLDQGVINQEQYQKAVEAGRQSKTSVLRILTEMGALPEDKRVEILANHFKWPSVKLAPPTFDPSLANQLGRDTCARLRALPLSKSTESVSVAMEDPSDVKAIGDIERVFSLPVVASVCTTSDFEACLPRVASFEETAQNSLGKRRIRGVIAVGFLLVLTIVPIAISYWALFSDPEISAWLQSLELTSFTTSLLLMLVWISWASIAYFITDVVFSARKN